MALVAFLRGVNVGGNKTFRPSVFAKDLSRFDVVNIGAAGTFVIRKPGSRAAVEAAFRKKLPFETAIMLCDARDLLRLETEHPFGSDPAPADHVRFISVWSKPASTRPSMPILLPPEGDWLVRVIASKGRFTFGEYRRHMKTIGYLSQMDKLFGATATTRNWNTVMAILKVLKSGKLTKS